MPCISYKINFAFYVKAKETYYRRICRRGGESHENDISAEKALSSESARLQSQNVHSGRKKSPSGQTCEGKEETGGLRKRSQECDLLFFLSVF